MQETQIIIAMIAGLATLMLALWKCTDNKIDRLDQKLSQKIDHTDEKLNRLGERVSRIEGILQTQQCCLLNDHKKASSD